MNLPPAIWWTLIVLGAIVALLVLVDALIIEIPWVRKFRVPIGLGLAGLAGLLIGTRKKKKTDEPAAPESDPVQDSLERTEEKHRETDARIREIRSEVDSPPGLPVVPGSDPRAVAKLRDLLHSADDD